MANNYAQFSEIMVVPEDKLDAMSDFLTKYADDIDDGQYDFFGGVEVQLEGTELWLHSDENYMDEELFYLAHGALKVIDDPDDKPFFVNVAYTCSRPRVGEFSGGCYVFWKDKDYYVDPFTAAMDYVKFHDGKPE